MSTTINISADTSLGIPTEEVRTSQVSATNPALPAHDARGLEVLVRLIVKDEIQRHLLAQPPSFDARTDEKEAIHQRASTTTADTPLADSDAGVMSAHEVAAFLGVDRNTVYDYAGRGTIPCRRLGKRLLFHKPALVSWLDPCKVV